MTHAAVKGCAGVEQPSWAAQEMASVNLGDQRLNRRAARLLETLGAKPTVSIPAACKGWAETQAAYRFFAQERVTVQELLAPHGECTLKRARAHPVVLAIQDTSELDYTGKSDILGLDNLQAPAPFRLAPGRECLPTVGAIGPYQRQAGPTALNLRYAARSSHALLVLASEPNVRFPTFVETGPLRPDLTRLRP
jgi:hypothetical protein